MTLTSTYTDTVTITVTNTGTNTLTSTHTQTNTVSASITNTVTHTQTATITITPVPFPYVINIGVYNEAGELVKVIASTESSNVPQQILLLLNGSQTGVMSPGSGTPLTIQVPGIETPDQQKTGGVSFTWDGTNSAGQDVTNGIYYIKETTTDPYGHTEVITKEITAITGNQYVELKIFNSAGELVDDIIQEKSVSGNILLQVNNTIGLSEVGNNNVSIIYGDQVGDYINWNGKNAQGAIVQSGTYEMEIIVRTSAGNTIITSKTVTVLVEGNEFISNIKVQPNPFVTSRINESVTGSVLFTWISGSTGTVRVKIYNVAGELIRTLGANVQDGKAQWDGKTVAGNPASSGIYICVLEAKSDTGYSNKVIVRFAVINK